MSDTNGVAPPPSTSVVVPGKLTELDLHKHELSYFKGVAPSDPMNKMWAFSISIRDAAFVPPAARGDQGTVFFMIARGQEIGIPWTQAVTSLYPMSKKMDDGSIHTRLGMEGHVALALLLSKGFKCKVLHSDNKYAEWWIQRPDGAMEFQDTFTIDEAFELGLTRKPNWKYPKDMLRWRAFMRVGRIVGADVLGGLYLPDELTDDIVMQPDASGAFTPRDLEAEADQKAEEDPALAITPKVKHTEHPAHTEVSKTVGGMPPADARNAAFFAEQEKRAAKEREQVAPVVCTLCGETNCEHLPDAPSSPKDVQPEPKKPEISIGEEERRQLKQRIRQMVQTIEGANARMISAFVSGYCGEQPVTDATKVTEALDALEAAIKEKPADTVSLTIDAAAFGTHVRTHPPDETSICNSKKTNTAGGLPEQFPAWSAETVELAHQAMRARRMDEKKFTTALKSFGFTAYSNADAHSALKLFYHGPDALLLLKYARTEKNLAPADVLKIAEKFAGQELTADTPHDIAQRGITDALSEVRS